MVIKKVQSVEVKPFDEKVSEIASRILKENDIIQSTIFGMKTNYDLSEDIEIPVPIFYKEFNNKKVGIFKTKNKTFGGFQIKF